MWNTMTLAILNSLVCILHFPAFSASLPLFLEILYERLVDVDQVDFLFAPLSSATGPVLALANERQIPLINGALFE